MNVTRLGNIAARFVAPNFVSANLITPHPIPMNMVMVTPLSLWFGRKGLTQERPDIDIFYTVLTGNLVATALEIAL